MKTLQEIISALGELTGFLSAPLFHIQKTPVTVNALLGALLCVLLACLASHLLQRTLTRKVFPRVKLAGGLQYAFLRLTHYLFLSLGVVLGLQWVGLDLSNLAFVAGLIGVGVGFGLQHIASNLVAGIILLFERPIKIGDRISIGSVHGDVHQINMRSTTVLTPDHIAIIVPNSDFITGQVINWSHEDPRVQFHLKVNVSYQSDLKRAQSLLLETALAHPSVLKPPAPQVICVAFGDTGVQMELLVWVADPKIGVLVLSDLYEQVLPLLIEAGIEIPVPALSPLIRPS